MRAVVAPTIVAVSVVLSCLARAQVIRAGRLLPATGGDFDPWKLLTAPFLHGDVGYAFVALATFALFGSWLERTLGRVAVIAVWVVAGGAAAWLASVDSLVPASGALAPAVAVTVARGFAAVEARRDGEEQDLVGIAVVAVVLLAMPPLVVGASWYAVATGVVCGVIAGSLAVVRQRSGRAG